MKFSTKVDKYWTSYFLIKLFYMFFAVLVYSKITILGDTSRWTDGVIEVITIEIFYHSTHLIDFVGGVFSILLGSVLGNMPFMILAFYGIYYPVLKLNLTKKHLLILLFLLSLPTFGIWSSIAGKEAVSVFFMGVLLGYIVNMLEQGRIKPNFVELIAFYLLILFKAQYSITIVSIILYVYLSKKFKLKSFGKSLLFCVYLSISLLILYIFKDEINELSLIMHLHFDSNGASTRENNIFLNDYDIFLNAPYGMFIGFWGPTLSEAIQKPFIFYIFIENLIILSYFMYFLLKIMLSIANDKKINVLLISLLFMSTVWILFVHYPFAVFNPGAALRYRENFYSFLVIFLFYLHNKYIFKRTVA